MSRITEMLLEPQTVYEGNTFTVKIKVRDDYKYKKYIVSENIKYTTIQGSSFTLTNVNGSQPGSILEIVGKSIQNGTPTPDAPIEIQSVEKDNDIIVTGKNKFHDYATNNITAKGIKLTYTERGIKLNGSYDKTANVDIWLTKSSSAGYSNNMTLLKANKQYSISIRAISGSFSTSGITCRISARTVTEKTFTWNYQTPILTNNEWRLTFTPTTDIYVGGIRFYLSTSNTAVFNNAELGIQIEENPTVTDFEEYKGNKYRVDLGGDNLIQNNMANQTLNGITFTINKDKSINVKGTATARTEPNLWTNANWTMKAGTNYYNNSNTTIYLYGSYNGANAYYIFNAGATYNREYDYIVQRVYIRVENGATVNTTYYPYIGLKKSENYSPYTDNPIKLDGIGNYNNQIKINTGKNKFNSKDTIQDDYITGSGMTYSIDNGVYTLNGSNTRVYIFISYNLTLPAGTYTYSGCPSGGSNTGYSALIKANNNTNYWDYGNGVTFTLTEEQTITVYPVRVGSARITVNNLKFYTMINEGTAAEPYEPHQKPGEWYIEKPIKRYKFTGSEYYGINTNWDNSYTNILHIFTNDVPNWKTGQTEFYSNNFKCTIESGRNFTQEMMTCHTTNASVYFFIAYSRLNGVTATSTNTQKVAAFKEWLNNNPTEIEYRLNNTEYEEITNEGLINQLNEIQNLQMQEGETNIYWTGEVAPEMKLQYATNEELHDYIITEDGKRIRTDWRSIGRR